MIFFAHQLFCWELPTCVRESTCNLFWFRCDCDWREQTQMKAARWKIIFINTKMEADCKTTNEIISNSMSEWLRRKIGNLLGFAQGRDRIMLLLLINRALCSSVCVWMRHSFAIDILVIIKMIFCAYLPTSYFIKSFLIIGKFPYKLCWCLCRCDCGW